MSGKARVLVAGDGAADAAAVALSRALRDAGVEVIYTAATHTTAELVRGALQEDVDAVAVSGAETTTRCAELRGALAEHGADDIVVALADDVAADVAGWVGSALPG